MDLVTLVSFACPRPWIQELWGILTPLLENICWGRKMYKQCTGRGECRSKENKKQSFYWVHLLLWKTRCRTGEHATSDQPENCWWLEEHGVTTACPIPFTFTVLCIAKTVLCVRAFVRIHSSILMTKTHSAASGCHLEHRALGELSFFEILCSQDDSSIKLIYSGFLFRFVVCINW